MNHGQTKESTAIANQRTAILSNLRATFGSPAGAATLEVLKARAGHGRPACLPTAGGAICPYAACYRDGRKSVIEEILADLAIPEDAGPAIEPRAVGGPHAG